MGKVLSEMMHARCQEAVDLGSYIDKQATVKGNLRAQILGIKKKLEASKLQKSKILLENKSLRSENAIRKTESNEAAREIITSNILLKEQSRLEELIELKESYDLAEYSEEKAKFVKDRPRG